MNQAFRGRGVVRAAVLVPWAIPTVVAALLWRFLFDSQAGIANAALIGLGVLDEPIVWFVRAATAWVPVILADVWKTTPFVALLLLAGLQNIDPALHEAAAVDGAGAWRRLRDVTLPLIRNTLLFVMVILTIGAFQVFISVYVMTGGKPLHRTDVILTYMYSNAFEFLDLGYGSAIAYMLAAMVFLLSIVQIRLLRRKVEY